MEKFEDIKADFDWVKVGGRYFSEAFMVASDTVSDIGDKVECSYNARISKEELSVWIWNKLTATATRREDGIWKQPSGSGWAERFSGADYIVPPTSTGADAQRRYESDMRGLVADGKVWDGAHGSANPKASSNALQVRPLLVVSYKERFSFNAIKRIQSALCDALDGCGWFGIVLDCQDESKVQAFAPGLPDINAMDTDEAITMLEALLEGLKRGRGDGGG